MRALIGYTGFVGGYLSRQMDFEAMYHRSSIEWMKESKFSLVVCAGLPAEKWRANQNPEEDRDNMLRLMSTLERVEAERFVLISTIDVYRAKGICDETSVPAPEHAYGVNRRALEQFVEKRFPKHHIVRLPAMFGQGLKKNALFDLLQGVEKVGVNRLSAFQWYDVGWLWEDLKDIIAQEVRVANLFTPPIAMEDLAARFFPLASFDESADVISYQHRTVRTQSGYIHSADRVWMAMAAFISRLQGVSI